MSQLLPADCLNEIFEYFENDKVTLHSCLLVSRLRCEVSVRILWTSVWNYDTLIACLPNESKEILYKNGIITSTSTSKPPLFNYIAFIRNLEIDNIIKNILKKYHQSPILNNKKCILVQEIYKLFNQISSLRELHFCSKVVICAPNVTPTLAGDCLKHLSKLSCCSDIYPEIFYQLSQICHNIQSLKIKFKDDISVGLTDLISAQKGLKHLDMAYYYCKDLTNIIASLMKHSNSLIKLNIYKFNIPLSFIGNFTNLQELELSFKYEDAFKNFTTLQYVTFPQLQILKFPCGCRRCELLVIRFLENNGKNLKELYVDEDDNSLNLAIAKFCPNLRKLYTAFKKDESETLKIILNSCQYLESMKVSCHSCYFLGEKGYFDILAKYSPKNFHELTLCPLNSQSLHSKDLEEFFINWKNRTSQKSLTFNVSYYRLNDENMKVIEKYKKLGVVKKLKLVDRNYF